MASWMVHLRVADFFMDSLSALSPAHYVAGSIGPDCGEPDESWTVYNPPSQITHWCPGASKEFCDYDAFYRVYLDPLPADIEKRSFYLGYYIHLITDVLWVREIVNPLKVKYASAFQDKYEMINAFRDDWEGQDRLFFREHPDFRSFCLLEQIRAFPNRYLDYYSDTALLRQFRFISEFYRNSPLLPDRPYRYTDKADMERFIGVAVERIAEILRCRASHNAGNLIQ